MLKKGLMITCFCVSLVNAQGVTKNTFGKGIKIYNQDSSFTMKFSTRIQNRYESIYDDGAQENKYSDVFYLRRARLKFDGYAFNPKFLYKIELDVVNGEVLDAVVKWKFAKNFQLWFGQTKLAGNRERVISSQKLQFVDRSLLNSNFTIDRDKGIQLRHKFKLGGMLFREVVSVSMGEGKNYKTKGNNGNCYTGRIEFLPLGEFTSKGDYFSSDLKREAKPKIAFGVTYDFNDNAIRKRGQLGGFSEVTRDLSSIFADMMFKYKGFSLMAEYANKTTKDGDALIVGDNGAPSSFYTGEAVNTQMGYLFKNNWELAARYTMVVPEKIIQENEIKQYTFGISKYIVGHSLKIQSDFSLTEEENKENKYGFRLQVELAF